VGVGAVAVECAERGAGGGGSGGGRPHPYPATIPPLPGLPCVLIVEDEPGIRELYVQLLTLEGFRTASAESALGALALIRRLRPAAVVLDLGLPYVSGLHLLAELRADPDPAVRAVPVVVASALTETLPPDRRAQVSAVLSKPFSLRVLADTVRAAIGGAARTGAR
jgi:CheY-like chemotaxis protein